MNKKNIEFILAKLLEKDFFGLDIKKLKGHESIFRVRRGRLRIIYKVSQKSINILEVGIRSGNTYKI